MSTQVALNVLVVDDQQLDRYLLRHAVTHAGYTGIRITEAIHGEDALEKLRNATRETLPDLILLDVFMPVMNGHEFLTEVKKDKRLSRIPVVMLSTSAQDDDVSKAYERGAASYLSKPVQPTDFNDAVRSLGLYWFQRNRYPER